MVTEKSRRIWGTIFGILNLLSTMGAVLAIALLTVAAINFTLTNIPMGAFPRVLIFLGAVGIMFKAMRFSFPLVPREAQEALLEGNPGWWAGNWKRDSKKLIIYPSWHNRLFGTPIWFPMGPDEEN